MITARVALIDPAALDLGVMALVNIRTNNHGPEWIELFQAAIDSFPEVVEAARKGEFSIYAVEHVNQGIEILTGIKAGDRGSDGRFPAGTINRSVEDKLKTFAERARAFGARAGGSSDNDGDRTS